MPTFKILGEIHHRIGSLLLLLDKDSQYLEIYLIGVQEDQTEVR